MSIYFSTHKKKKIFPFSLFGYAALLVLTGLTIYLWQTDFSIQFFMSSPSENTEIGLIGIAIIVTSFLLFFLNLGIITELKSKFKFPLYIMAFLFLVISATCGYFIKDQIFNDLIIYFFFIGSLFFITVIIFFLIQHRVYSKYYSYSIMIISSTPIAPFLYFTSKIIAGYGIDISSGILNFDNIALYALLFTMLLYTSVNSVYLSYINRRVY